MVATDLAKVAADPLGARRRRDRLVVRRTRRHETVVAALKETALRSTVRLSTGLPIHVSIVCCIIFFLLHSKANVSASTEYFIYVHEYNRNNP